MSTDKNNNTPTAKTTTYQQQTRQHANGKNGNLSETKTATDQLQKRQLINCKNGNTVRSINQSAEKKPHQQNLQWKHIRRISSKTASEEISKINKYRNQTTSKTRTELSTQTSQENQ